MSRPIICTLGCLLFCLYAQRGAEAQEGRFFTDPPFVYPAPRDLRSMMADRPAGFCVAKTTENSAYLLVVLRNTRRAMDDTERVLDRIGKDLGLRLEKFFCPPEDHGRFVFKLLLRSGKQLQEFLVPDELLDAPGYR
jgi:hypothetical protein